MSTCDRCSIEHPDYHITVQRDGEALCYRCVNEHNARLRAEAKAARAAAPKCECCGTRRGTWRVCKVLLCGTCKKRALKAREEDLAGYGSLALVVALSAAPLSRDQVLELAGR